MAFQNTRTQRVRLKIRYLQGFFRLRYEKYPLKRKNTGHIVSGKNKKFFDFFEK